MSLRVIHSTADGKIEDTGPLSRKRMETIDDEVTAGALDFMERATKANKPFFLWWNSTRMHVFTRLKEESRGVTGLGIVGLAWFSVTQRRKQIGTRRALGATLWDVMRYFMVEIGLVSAAGLVLERVGFRHLFRLAFHFGLFQFLMPVLGWLAGRTVVQYVEAWDHWLAFGLLSFVGGKAIWEAFHQKEQSAHHDDPTRGLTLVMLSVATSIDALAVGRDRQQGRAQAPESRDDGGK